MRLRQISIVLILLTPCLTRTANAQAASCPDLTIEIRREMPSEQVLRIICKPIDELSIIDLATLDPAAIARLSPASRAELQRRRGAIPSLPSIEPRVFQDPQWLNYVREQERRLRARRAYLTRQLSYLRERGRGPIVEAITDNDALLLELIEDNYANTLTVIGELGKLYLRFGGAPPGTFDSASVLVGTALAGVNLAAAARTSDWSRQADKLVDAAIAIKDLVSGYPSSRISARDREAFRRGTDSLFKMVRLSQRWVDGEPFDKAGMAAAADDLIQATEPIPGLELLRAARATVGMAVVQYRMSQLEDNREVLWRIYQEQLAAETYLNSRISQIDEWLAQYRSSLPR